MKAWLQEIWDEHEEFVTCIVGILIIWGCTSLVRFIFSL